VLFLQHLEEGDLIATIRRADVCLALDGYGANTVLGMSFNVERSAACAAAVEVIHSTTRS